MRKLMTLSIAAAAAMTLAACGQTEEEAAADLAEQKVEAQEDILEENADLADAQGEEMAEERLDEQADMVGEMREDDAMAEEMPAE